MKSKKDYAFLIDLTSSIDPFHSSNFSCGQTNLDPVRMRLTLCKDILDDPFGSNAGPLIFLQYDGYLHSGFDVISVLPIHVVTTLCVELLLLLVLQSYFSFISESQM